MEIDSLVKYNDKSLPDSFVSIATKINKKNIPTHAAIIIRYKNRDFLHHYPGINKPEVIENFNNDDWYIYKIFEQIKVDNESDVGAFLQQCIRICDKSQITYSFIIDNSHYDATANYSSGSGLPELSTCVGFCINTLMGFVFEDSYFELDDWDAADLVKEWDQFGIEQTTKKYPNLDWDLYNAFKKRITPLEYLCSAFFNEYPIRKAQIEEIKAPVMEAILNK